LGGPDYGSAPGVSLNTPIATRNQFTKQYFEKHGEACCADVYHGLSEEIERLNATRAEIGEAPFRSPNYSSFSRYFHWFLILGLIECTDKREPAIYDFLEKRVFYKLTGKGEAEVSAWQDPVRAAHPEFGWTKLQVVELQGLWWIIRKKISPFTCVTFWLFVTSERLLRLQNLLVLLATPLMR